ncbi:DUF2306 domain-containing protein [Hymenobacter jeollabukensis]|uniref:DUF2306 domain-containing protein n=1 Tax=Hymenobacter jeollabukensis TaxID=2025313 RepID=A0A5R8WNG0_9BACT|nr:DUF2306 domain-containing protein [Hymenobacter jeollabukensis]TLM91244.1 DUF2306 domain-containing protein [Hymenobacter jeollabukensis]
MAAAASFSRVFQGLFGLGVVLFTGLMLTKVVPYLSFEPGIDFLTTKSAETNASALFRLGFYVHITSSLWVMATGLVQFFPRLWAGRRALHRTLGKVYVASVLLLAAPSGLILALYANGGLVAKVGFTLQCLVWWLSTWQAYRTARQRQWQPHTDWMLRSYLVTLAAMSLRLESFGLFYLFQTKPIETYLTVTWLSWTGNLVLAEVLIQAGVTRRLLRTALAAAPQPSATTAKPQLV